MRRSYLIAIIVVIAMLAIILLSNLDHKSPSSFSESLKVDRIRLILVQYAQDHGGAFPYGHTSTEVFQQLINDKYAQSGVFWFEMPGKLPSTNDFHVTDENVCFDFTQGANLKSPTWVPLVIPTGYKINYATGEALRLPTNVLPYDDIRVAYIGEERQISIVRNSNDISERCLNAIRLMPDTLQNADVSHYKQLTPNGALRNDH